MIELPDTEFKLGNYDPSIIPHTIFLGSTEDFRAWLLSQIILGYQKYPAYRCRDGCYAVMFLCDDGEYWCHVPDYVINSLLGSVDL